MNWIQRSILVTAGAVLLLLAVALADDDMWIRLAMFLAAVGCLVLAAAPRSKSDA